MESNRPAGGDLRPKPIFRSNIRQNRPFLFVSPLHKDLVERLPQFNRALYLQVKEVLEVNKAQRHIRGGIATRRKYRGEGKERRA